MNEYQVKAHWDEEAKVWWSESDELLRGFVLKH